MDEDQRIYENIMFEEVNMNENNGDEYGVLENIDCSDTFNYNFVFC